MNTAVLRARFDRWLQRQWQKRGLWMWLLSPFSLLFYLAVWIRRQKHATPRAKQKLATSRVSVPILIVGNLYIGGTGKTPVVIALVQQLKALGWEPGVISRGYGTKIGTHAVTGRGQPEARSVGDEPALIAKDTGAPISVHPDRSLACRTLLVQYPEVDLIIADDGLQHLRLARDIEIIVQDERGCGNGWMLPAGPLREPFSRLSLADAVVTRVTRPDNASLTTHSTTRQSALLAGGLPRSKSPRRVSMSLNISRFQRLSDPEIKEIPDFLSFTLQCRVAAVAGIATPSRFFDDLRHLGLHLALTLPLADHFSYDKDSFAAIEADVIVITGKDAVKCRAISDPRIWIAETKMTFSDPDFLPWLDHQIKVVRARLSRD